jgi:signal transduction histidine kinase
MKKIIFLSIIAYIALISLQGGWIYNIHKSYKNEQNIALKQCLNRAIQDELNQRLEHSKIQIAALYGYKKDSLPSFLPEKAERIWTRNTPIDTIKSTDVPNGTGDLARIAMQDALLKLGIPLDSAVLKKALIQQLQLQQKNFDFTITLYNQDTLVTQQFGNSSPEKTQTIRTGLIHLGQQQFIEVSAYLPATHFVKQMSLLIIISTLVVLFIIGSIFYLQHIIHRKDQQFKLREMHVNGIIHDLKSPLNAIITMLGWLEKKEDRSAQKDLLQKASSQANHAVGDIDSLLLTARMDRRKIMLKKESINLISLVENIQKEFKVQYNHKPHKIQLVTQATTVYMNGDRLYLESVIRNLVDNAIKYANTPVIITIDISCTSTVLTLKVKDNGWGIAKKNQAKIFEPFFQIPLPKGQLQKGYGVGLSFAQYIVKAHGGSIKVESQPQKGSLFTCRFPID